MSATQPRKHDKTSRGSASGAAGKAHATKHKKASKGGATATSAIAKKAALTRCADGELSSYFDDKGHIRIDLVIRQLMINSNGIAYTAGLSPSAFSKNQRKQSPKIQSRLRELLEILFRVKPWAGSLPAAFAWYRSTPLPSFGNVTAEALVREDHADWVRAYLDRIAEGGYA